MISAHYVEMRSRKLPGEEPVTIIREVNAVNGQARKTIKVLRGDRVVSNISEPLTTFEKRNIQNHKFTKSLYKSLKRKTMKKMKKPKRK